MPTMNAFAFLPNEIINDVVDFAGERRESKARIDHQFLIRLNGSWGDFARRAAPVLLILPNHFVSRNHGIEDQKLTFEKTKNQFICHSVIGWSLCDGTANLDQFRQLAPNFYEFIEFFCVPSIPSDVFDLIGDRFSEVRWWAGMIQNTLDNEASNFLKRQLRSHYLKKMTIDCVHLKDDEFTDAFLHFTKKPTFESLNCLCCPYMSPVVIIEADQAWNAKRDFQMTHQTISGLFTYEAAKELKEYFKIPQNEKETDLVVCHTVPLASKIIRMCNCPNEVVFKVEFCYHDSESEC